MSNRITNAQRNEFLESVLRSTFEPRFEALWAKVDALAADEVNLQHPHWIRGRKDKGLLPYMPASGGVEVRFLLADSGESSGIRARRPLAWSGVARKAFYSGYIGRDTALRLEDRKSPVSTPLYIAVSLLISDKELCDEYASVWNDFYAAQETLTATIHAYNNREKFESDFPDLSKHLPKPAKVVGTAVAVQVGDVMAKLAKVGIPPKTK